MKAITLTQPWATLVAIGAKHYETRSWSTNYRGPLAIHAAKGFPKWAQDAMDHRPFYEVLHEQFQGYERGHVDEARGHVLAIVNVTAYIPTSARASASTLANLGLTDRELAFGDYSPGHFAWRLENVRRLPEPIPAKGALGLWQWEPPHYPFGDEGGLCFYCGFYAILSGLCRVCGRKASA
ncbi:MAG: ASCH domain-containing protein [Patescibacteria group bacterium]|nr:ASCH domain-containing protein [Patescibacteria group bacterium]